MVLLAIRLVALFVRLGFRGLPGFLLATIGTVMAVGALWSQVFVVPRLAEAEPAVADEAAGSVLAGFLLSFLFLGLGWVVFGVSALRAGVFPRPPVILLVVGAVVAILPLPSRALILEVAVAWLGLTLLRE
jgi:hypothetical protein